jgi:hypothetical protein
LPDSFVPPQLGSTNLITGRTRNNSGRGCSTYIDQGEAGFVTHLGVGVDAVPARSPLEIAEIVQIASARIEHSGPDGAARSTPICFRL